MKERIDRIIVKKGLLETREKAQRYILAGHVYVNGSKVIKSSKMIPEDSKIEILMPNDGYVSRGGIKLKHAIDYFGLVIDGKKCLDIGSSTGGFTDCLLKEGASFVSAVDVGRGLLHNKLIRDDRVKLYESYNARYIDKLDIGYIPEIVTIDVSFISLRLILKPLLKIIDENTVVVSLIKPQFELERGFKGFRGVVKDKALHKRILLSLNEYFKTINLNPLNYHYSPIKGPKGNIEYFVLLVKGKESKKKFQFKGNNAFLDSDFIDDLVDKSHADLNNKGKL